MTGTLRKVLRGLVPSRRKDASTPSWQRPNLLFICTHGYEHFRLAYFKAPPEGSKTARLAAFGWGPDIPARTACEFNLPPLAWPAHPGDAAAWVEQWASAFDVEKVTKRFYADYAARFADLRDAVTGLAGEDQKRFTQALLNRLMFLRFIERKGWLTAPPAGPADGRADGRANDYLRRLFAAGGHRGKSFYAGRLKKLFFEGLAVEGKQVSEAIGRVPFLNGGLFEESDLDKAVADLPDAAFAPLLGEDGLFYRYNFTVQESTPLDIEVAVDPEMLGKVFEELVTDRHGGGKYYTPRPVVSFMCREALKGHLADATGIDAGVVAAFVDRHDAAGLTLGDARKVAAALDTLRAVDPACGSGAYLLGLLHEIVDLYRLLYSEKLKDDNPELHRIKLNVIERSLYGVDKDAFATSIAMLRLWLSLTVDSDEPRPLPNLDFKIETGDSVTGPDPQQYDRGLVIQEKAYQLSIIKGKYLRAHGDEKQSLRRLIRKEEREIAFELRSLSPGSIDWRVQFCEVFFSDRGGFDIVLANPPYVRQELIKDIKPRLKQVYGPLYSGTADLYVFFYLRALQLLAKGGMLVFISSNKWFRAGYGKKLREHIAKTTTVQTILDFHDLPVFESAIAYPMIFVASKRNPSLTHSPTLAEPPSLNAPYPNVTEVVATFGHPISAGAFNTNGSWHLSTASAASRLDKMRAAGPPLGAFVRERIFMGLKTGLNEAWVDSDARVYSRRDQRPSDAMKEGVFYLNEPERDRLIEADAKSAELIKQLVQGRDIGRWRIDHRKQWMIVTKIGVDIESYPAILEHLSRFESALKKRTDQGDHWWELRPCTYYDEFDKQKIVYQEIATYQRFALDDRGVIFNNKVFFIASNDLYLLGVLNSSPAWSFLHEVAAKLVGGAYAMQVPYVRQLPIPDASPADRAAIAALAQQCLDARGVGVAEVEREIDDRVAKLYGLKHAPIVSPVETKIDTSPELLMKHSKPGTDETRRRTTWALVALRDHPPMSRDQLAEVINLAADDLSRDVRNGKVKVTVAVERQLDKTSSPDPSGADIIEILECEGRVRIEHELVVVVGSPTAVPSTSDDERKVREAVKVVKDGVRRPNGRAKQKPREAWRDGE